MTKDRKSSAGFQPAGSDAGWKPALLGRLVARHALGWLAMANAVGVLLAAELMWPALGDALAPLSYGRWMPLHMNWQLYGWCALPLVGVLLAWCLDERHPQVVGQVRIVLGAWSLALALGGVAWLGGVTSGKLFLDWHGWARAVLPLAMIVLWTVCAAHAWWRRDEDGGRVNGLRGVILAGLLFVPGLLYWSIGREVYPSVNPDSGGATGASLLGSTLGIVTVFGLLPVMLRLPVCHLLGDRLSGEKGRDAKPGCHLLGDKQVWSAGWFWGALAGSWAVFAGIDHGHASHHGWAQVGGLGLLIGWVPLAWGYFRRFEWEASVRPWLYAAFVWWLLLVITGWLSFLPGVSERLKFTNGLVAHAHLAMAGLVTSVNFVILRQLAPRREPRGNFALWQGACVVHVAALLTLGWWERDYAGDLFRGETWTQLLYAIRLAAGAAMLAASVRWLAAGKARTT